MNNSYGQNEYRRTSGASRATRDQGTNNQRASSPSSYSRSDYYAANRNQGRGHGTYDRAEMPGNAYGARNDMPGRGSGRPYAPANDRRSRYEADRRDDYRDPFDDGLEDDFEDDFDDDFADDSGSNFSGGFGTDAFDDFDDFDDDSFDSDELDSFLEEQSHHTPRTQTGYRQEYEPAGRQRHNESASATESASADVDTRSTINRTTYILCLVALAMCVLSACLVSSGRLIEVIGTHKDQRSAVYDIQSGVDSVRMNTINTINGAPKVYTLPMSNTPANVPNQDNYSSYVDENGVTHDTYIDDTISVDCWRARYQMGNCDVMAAIAKVKIAHPTQFRSGFASGEFGTRKKALTATSKHYNAIVAINGEMYNHPGRDNLLIRHGTLYRNKVSDQSVLFVDANGDFIIKPNTKVAVKEEGILEDSSIQIMHTFTFGPPLIIDGEIYQHEGLNLYVYRNPRTAIGQLGPLEYLMVVVEGRTKDSDGVPVDNLSKFMLDMGCKQAYNLDGGQSSEMVFNHKLHSVTCYGNERGNGDMLYFGTAMPEQ